MAYITPTNVRSDLNGNVSALDADIQTIIDQVHSMVVEMMGFEFGGSSKTRKLDGDGDDTLYLPAPGAASIVQVVEDGVTLAPSAYELDPDRGLFLLRLDTDGDVSYWPSGRRNITVMFNPRAVPAALMRAEITEVVRIFHGRQAGMSDTIGVEDGARVYTAALSKNTRHIIDVLLTRYRAATQTGIAGA